MLLARRAGSSAPCQDLRSTDLREAARFVVFNV